MKKILASLFFMLSLVASAPSRAEDIDLFAGSPTTTFLPNVLIVLDNTANWNTAFTNEMAALQAVFAALPADKFRVGLMLYTESGGGNGNPDGGYVRAAVRTMSAANQTKYAALIASLDKLADKGNGRGMGSAMAEAYKYFAQATAYAGANKVKRDYTGNASGTAASNAIYALSGNAFASAGSTTYVSPVQDGCQGNFIIYIGNTTSTGNVTQDNTADNSAATTLLTAAGGDATQISISPTGFADNISDEWTRFMKASPYGITTYTIDVTYGSNGNGPANSALLESMANQGGGNYFKIDAGTTSNLTSDIEQAMGQVFSKIQSVNSAFASVSLPVSVNTQGTFLNQVFVGMFRPGEGATPRWAGNLKQYKLGLSNGNLKLLDSTGKSAINSVTGFVDECAQSFWTPGTTDTYWSFKSWPTGTTFCLPPTGSAATLYKVSNYPDGNIVEKGGQAYKTRTLTSRTMYTCGSTMSTCASSSSLVTFNNSNVTATMLGVSSGSDRDAIINWARGADVTDEDTDSNVTEMRPSVHGDVVHSRPVAVNFGGATEATSNVIVFYGGNDGLLRAVNGNRGDLINNTNITSSYPPGSELWTFMPPEFYAKIKRLKDNSTLVFFPSETYAAGTTTAAKDYGMDGPITAFSGTISGANKVFVYGSMRRGGRSIYGFDVTSMLSTPSTPTLKWRIGCSDATTTTDCTSNDGMSMSGVGQTWSSAKLFTTAGFGSGASPLLIFGGGYDTCEDVDASGANNNCASVTTPKGHYVYIVNADTGRLVKVFDTGSTRGVVADVTLVRDSSGQVILGYTADLGGNVYRIKFGTGDSSTWTMTRIADLGCASNSTCSANRKFMFAPSVVTTDTISMDATFTIMLGSGDREKPVSSYSASYGVTNYFFQFKDKPNTASATFPGNTDGCGSAIICLNSLLGITSSSTPSDADLAAKKGWYLGLAAHEQVVTSSITIFGVVTFSTHQPFTGSGNACTSNLGTTLVYNIGFTNAAPANGTSRFEDVSGDGLPPSPVGGQVTLDDGTTVPFCVGCTGSSPLEAKLPTSFSTSTQSKGRLYWYINR